MKLIKVGAGVLNQVPLGWRNNRGNIVAAIRQAKRDDVTLLCLPELAITGHGCEDAFQSPSLQQTTLELLLEILPETEGIAVAIGLPLTYRKALFDTVGLLVDGRIAGFVAKKFLAGDGLYYEPRWFKPWPEHLTGSVRVDGRDIPLGDLVFRLDGVHIGFEICEDAWVADRPGSDLAQRGVDIILNPSASHFAFDKFDVRRRFVLEGSRAFGVSYVYANLLGNESGRSIFDGGALIATGGRLLAQGPRFGFGDWHVTSAVIDVDETRMQQVRTGSFRPDLQQRPSNRISVPFEFPSIDFVPSEPQPAAWERSESRKEEEFTRAVSLALFDYLRKSRSRGFVVSLSGGADSAASSCLVALMVSLARAELGDEGFRSKLGYLDLPVAAEREELVRQLLLCVYQSARNSSQTTRAAARAVAEGIGAEHLELDVDGLVEAYTAMVSQAVGRDLTWEQDDLALQNIQARVRGPGVWMLANLRGALLLATSNRSEAAVGYTTMDGDTCGGLSPIGGIDKAFLRQWLSWLETRGPEEFGALPALSQVTRQQPTAELRPSSSEQTDEGDLMPYDILDAVERAAIRDKKAPVEVYRTLRGRRPEVDRRQLAAWVERFFRLWCRNQWKRERYAPSFHVDDENLDPKTWCRFPILSGGFDREIEALHRLVEADTDA
ncbi:MAG: NAD(+) synthase [Acidobacteriota bacterium]